MSNHAKSAAHPTTGNGQILVPVDFSDCASEVVTQAITIALDTGATIDLLHVVDLGDVDPQMVVPRDDDPSQRSQITAVELLEAEAQTSLSKLAAQAQAAGVQVTKTIILGAAADAIVRHANTSAPRMIVMGTHGRSGLSRWMLGSIAEVVTRRANVPVVTHRTHHKPHCEPGSCAWCGSHITPGMARLRAESQG